MINHPHDSLMKIPGGTGRSSQACVLVTLNVSMESSLKWRIVKPGVYSQLAVGMCLVLRYKKMCLCVLHLSNVTL